MMVKPRKIRRIRRTEYTECMEESRNMLVRRNEGDTKRRSRARCEDIEVENRA
jgi:hypothetical protein